MADQLDVRKAFEAIAKIIGDREGVEIKVVAVREKEKENTKEPA